MKETFIVRIAGAGQYEVPGDEHLLAELNTLDNRIVALLQACPEPVEGKARLRSGACWSRWRPWCATKGVRWRQRWSNRTWFYPPRT